MYIFCISDSIIFKFSRLHIESLQHNTRFSGIPLNDTSVHFKIAIKKFTTQLLWYVRCFLCFGLLFFCLFFVHWLVFLSVCLFVSFWMWIAGHCVFLLSVALRRMITHSYKWISGSKNSTASKDGMKVAKKEKCAFVQFSSKNEFKGPLHGQVPHNCRDQFSCHSAVAASMGGEVSQPWDVHELLRMKLLSRMQAIVHWCGR